MVGIRGKVAAFLYLDSKGDKTLFSDQETYQDILHEAVSSPLHLSVVPSASLHLPYHSELSIPYTEYQKYLDHPGLPSEDSPDSDSHWKCHLCGYLLPISLSLCPNCQGFTWPYWSHFTAQIAYEMSLPENLKLAADRLISTKFDCCSDSQWECKFCRVVNPADHSTCVACYRTNFAMKLKSSCNVTGEIEQPHLHCMDNEEISMEKQDLHTIQAVDSDKESDKRAETEGKYRENGGNVTIPSGESTVRRYASEELSPPMTWRPPLPQFNEHTLEIKCRICPRTPEPGFKFCSDCLSHSDLSSPRSSPSSSTLWSCLKCGFRQNKEWNMICSQCFALNGKGNQGKGERKESGLTRVPMWVCRFCKAGNYISYPICRSCKRRNESDSPSTPAHLSRDRGVEEVQQWTCRWCWQRNLKVQMTCLRCGRPNGTSSQYMTMSRSARSTPRTSVVPGKENWPCPGCGLPLPLSTPVCQVCRLTRSSLHFPSK